MTLKHPTTPPYLSILLASIHVIAAVFDLGYGLMKENVNFGAVILDIIRICMAIVFIWLAGTFPLQPTLPARNVAGPKDVSF